jgi:hypothetical protein
MTNVATNSSPALLAIAVAALLLAACGGPSWQELTSPEGGFRVLMRGDPLVEKQDLQTPIGKITGHWYSTTHQDSVFGVGYADYPVEFVRNMPQRELFTTLRETWVKRISGKLQGGGTDISLESHPSMEYIASGTFNGKDAYLRGRLYLVGNRIFQVVVFGNKESLPLSDVNKFVSSFKLSPVRGVDSINLDVGQDKKPPLPEGPLAPAK